MRIAIALAWISFAVGSPFAADPPVAGPGHLEVRDDDPAPVIRVSELADNSVNFIVRPWVNTSDYWDVYWDVTRAVKIRFDEEDITIPFPQRDSHLFEAKKATASS